ncbi:uncharacterized protein LOC109719030 [Ananas comosus]|uniref:Uncharacterized protein LOC109719030 n=1 Tax=Ananas comosus TaxID=4615 RepID=A0A6P5FZV6_ANACO|nr:uncharacterized protein LOC109719030 [Ananas comosus]
MEKSTPVRKSHTYTADLLTWREAPAPEEAAPPVSRRPHQPSEAISKVVFGGQVTEEEAESLNKRKPCSGPKWKEMTGSGIFAAESEEDELDSGSAFSSPNTRTGSRAYQQTLTAISQISFSAEESVSPKKPTSIAEVAKQRELSGTLLSELDNKMKRQLSAAKSKELTGHADIFGPPPEDPPRSLDGRNSETDKVNGEPAAQNSHPSMNISNPAGGASSFVFGESTDTMTKTAKKIPTQKFTDLTGNDIFKEGNTPPGSVDKSLSVAKLKEMSGSDIFADEKAASRDYFGGVRKPPGGESSIALV